MVLRGVKKRSRESFELNPPGCEELKLVVLYEKQDWGCELINIIRVPDWKAQERYVLAWSNLHRLRMALLRESRRLSVEYYISKAK